MILFNVREHGEALAEEVGFAFNPAADTVIARVEHDQLLGGIVYQGYTGSSIKMHVASFAQNWICKDLLWVTFHYPFIQLGCKVIFGEIPASNLKALEFDKKIGFSEVVRIPDVYPDGDLVVMSLRREDCRWLRLRPRAIKARGNL